MQSLSSFTGSLTMPCAKQHWDYTPGHVYLDNDRISVIDILGLDGIPIYEDIGHFLAALTSINNLPFYPFFDYSRACLVLCDEFNNSYLNNTDYDRDKFLLLTNIYRLKYLIIYFLGQHRLVSQKTHPVIGNIYTDYRIVRLFNKPLLHTMNEITKIMNRVLNKPII